MKSVQFFSCRFRFDFGSFGSGHSDRVTFARSNFLHVMVLAFRVMDRKVKSETESLGIDLVVYSLEKVIPIKKRLN